MQLNNVEIDFSNLGGVREAIKRSRLYLVPAPDKLPSEYAEENYRIPDTNALPGPFRFRNAPYQREPLNMTVNPDVEIITLMWGAQTGKTQVQLMSIGYNVGHQPQNQILMQPTETDLTTWLVTKLDPMIETNDVLRRVIAKPRGREGVNNQKMKQYIGGTLMFSWSGSLSTLRGRSAPKLYCDEIDAYEKTKEGSQVSIISERNSTFGDERLLFLTSTPTDKGFSEIESHYQQGDGRRWFIRCPSCSFFQYFKWGQVKWSSKKDGTPIEDTVKYECEHCSKAMDDPKRVAASRDGEWVAEREFNGHPSYHLPTMASLFIRLKDLAKEFIRRKRKGDLQTFVNTKLAEASDRIELEVVGYNRDEESWAVDYIILPGDPTQDEVFNDLKDVLKSTYKHESGAEIPILHTFLDAGYLPKRVRDFCNKEGAHVTPILGRAGSKVPIIANPKKRSRVTRANRAKARKSEIVGVDEAKTIFYKRLQITKPGPGYCHFPEDRDEEYFLQLLSERLKTKYVGGRATKEWVKERSRNEALDCRNYAYAAFLFYGPDNLKEIVFEEKGKTKTDLELFKVF